LGEKGGIQKFRKKRGGAWKLKNPTGMRPGLRKEKITNIAREKRGEAI